MILAASDIISALPNFRAGCNKLHDLLIPVAAVLCATGVMIWSSRMQREGHVIGLGPLLVKLMVAVLLCVNLGDWGDMMNDGVWDLLNQTGFQWSGGDSGNVYHDLVEAIRNKWGTNGVAQAQQQLYNQVNQQGTAQTNGASTPINTNVHFTRYAYPGDGTPDTNSSNGIGNHGNQLTDGRSVAIPNKLVQQYGLQIGQTIQFTTRDGQVITRTYDDTVPDGVWKNPSTGKISLTPKEGYTQYIDESNNIDLYDPSNQQASLDGAAITGINGLGVQNNDNSNGNWLSSAMGWVGRLPEMGWMAFWSGAVWFLADVASGVLWCLEAIRQVLYCIEIAVSPLFIGMLLIPALVGIASRFFTYLAAVILWPIGAAVCDLVTKAIIDWAVNPTGNTGQQIALSLGGLGVWILLGIWVIFSSLAVPVVAHLLMAGGGSGVAGLIGTAFGVSSVSSAQRQAHKSAIMAASAMRSALTSVNNSNARLSSTNGNGNGTAIGNSPTTSNNRRP